MFLTLHLRTLFTAQKLPASPVHLLRRGIQSDKKRRSVDSTSAHRRHENDGQLFSLDDLDPVEEQEDGGTAAMHVLLNERRRDISFMRLIEHELPKLVYKAFRKPFIPPTNSTPVIVRSIEYLGEQHPAAVKRVIVVPVAKLPLKSDDAIHNFKLIAGVRWTPTPPPDSGVGVGEEDGSHGYVKISCEDFPRPAMNLKWASDALDRLIEEANSAEDTLRDIPLDSRHLDSRARKAKMHRGRTGRNATIQDFPRHWLPDAPVTQNNITPHS